MSLLRVMTFNVLNIEAPVEQPKNPSEIWENRAELNVQIIRRYDPSMIAFQEFAGAHWNTYRERFPEYSQLTHNEKGEIEGCAIFYKTDQFDPLYSGYFWLTRTPDRPDPDWGLPYALGVHWLILRWRETGIPLLFMNTQYEDGVDSEQYLMRAEGCKIQLQQIEEISRLAPGLPVILAGDFNFHVWSYHYRYFLEHGFVDTYRAAGLPDTVDSSTFHGFCGKDYFSLDWGDTLAWRVDWILTRDGAGQRLQTVSCTIARDAQPPLYPSDHYPVVAELLVLPENQPL